MEILTVPTTKLTNVSSKSTEYTTKQRNAWEGHKGKATRGADHERQKKGTYRTNTELKETRYTEHP